MPETAQEYIARILSNAAGQDGLSILRETPVRLKALLASSSPERWQRRLRPGSWSAAEILAHLADAELVTAWRFRSILAIDGAPLQAFDQDAWAEAFKYSQVDPVESLTTFTAARESLLSLLARVDPSRREHHGMHAERGRETVAHLIQLYAGHDLNHLKQIEALVEGVGT